MIERAHLLALLMDEEVVRALKERLSVDQRVDLILEIVNPYRPLTTKQQAELAGVTDRGLRKRKDAKPPVERRRP